MRFSKIFRIRLGSRILASKIQLWNEELHTHYGITNEVPNSKLYIPFWDFIEGIDPMIVVASLREVQHEQYLGDIYILQTYPKQSFRAVSFDPTTWQRYIKILSSTDLIDLSYLKHSIMRGRAVIRVSEKDGSKNIVIDKLISDTPPSMLQSRHHLAFFSSIYPEIPRPNPMPKQIQVRVSKYESFR